MFPSGDLFAPPIADQKQPRSHATWQRYRAGFGTFDVASVGFGDNFGLVRWPGGAGGNAWQLGISGAVFALFNLDSPSFDLLNADYVVGLPLSFRRGNWSARVRPFHLSSHLGDEFLLNPQPGPVIERINLSYEAVELLGAWERKACRIYGGGVHILSTDIPLGRDRAQVGFEYHGGPHGWRTGEWVAGLDVEAWDENEWAREISFKGGIRLHEPAGGGRSFQLLLEYYDGRVPHGQFFMDVEVEYFGLGFTLGF
ncbi:MAG: DUF1207 domain-containing protein [Acidobacteria bacterium]|nr:DUF1207 domain-containing protein [Acidobacteriota bacterium]